MKSSTSSRLRHSLATLLVAASSLIGAAAYAHHSISSTYLEDQTIVIEITGQDAETVITVRIFDARLF